MYTVNKHSLVKGVISCQWYYCILHREIKLESDRPRIIWMIEIDLKFIATVTRYHYHGHITITAYAYNK